MDRTYAYKRTSSHLGDLIAKLWQEFKYIPYSAFFFHRINERLYQLAALDEQKQNMQVAFFAADITLLSEGAMHCFCCVL